jgi:hypothetical protein
VNNACLTMQPRHLLYPMLAAICCAAHAGAPLIPVAQFAAGAEMSQPRLSPDGTHVVYLTTIDGARLVAMYDVKDGQSIPIMAGMSGTLEVTRCEFKTDTLLLCHLRGLMHSPYGTYGITRLVSVDREGKNLHALLQDDLSSGSVRHIEVSDRDHIIHMLPDDPRHVLIEFTESRSQFPSVYQLDVVNGAMHEVVAAHAPILRWVADRDGVGGRPARGAHGGMADGPE